MYDMLPAITPDDKPRVIDIYLDGITIRPCCDSQTGKPVRYDALYVGMRIPGYYLTEDAAYDAVIAWVTDPDPWQRNFPNTVAASRRIPGLA